MNDPTTVLAMTCSSGNARVFADVLRRHGYAPLAVTSHQELEAILYASARIDLAVIDVGGLEHGAWSSCRSLRERNIPFILVLPVGAAAPLRPDAAQGAAAVMVKPLKPAALVGMIEATLHRRTAVDRTTSGHQPST